MGKNSGHIFVANTTSGAYRLICANCGAHYDPALPIGMDMFSAVCKQFEKDHMECSPQEGVLSVEEIRLRPSAQYTLPLGRNCT
jgi:hypothetical protein